MKKSYLLFLILLITVSFSFAEEKETTVFKTLGKFSIQNVYLSFLYISSIEYRYEKSDEKETDAKLVQSVLKLSKSSLESLNNFKSSNILTDKDQDILDQIIDSNELLIEEIEYLDELIKNSESGILGKINKKHKKTWNSIKNLIEK